MGRVRKTSILLCMLLIAVVLNADNSLFSKLKETTDLKKGEYLAVIYQKNGTCFKCYEQPMRKIAEVIKSGKIGNPKILALVKCDRDIELNIFKKNHNWKYYMYRDPGDGWKKLRVPQDSYLTFFDYKGNIKYNFY